jgi:hypothetical protein
MRDDNRLYLHFIISLSRNEGNTQALLRRWLSDGWDVRVVMPRPIMQHILMKYYFFPCREYFPDQYDDEVEVWIRTGSLNPAVHLSHRQKSQVTNLLSGGLPAQQGP